MSNFSLGHLKQLPDLRKSAVVSHGISFVVCPNFELIEVPSWEMMAENEIRNDFDEIPIIEKTMHSPEVKNFEKDLELALAELEFDEWAVTRATQNFIVDMDCTEAFAAIMDILDLALKQNESYAFSSCCSLALRLARKADTTERPLGLDSRLMALHKHASTLAEYANVDVVELARWFRL